jgi:hypothetical protein
MGYTSCKDDLMAYSLCILIHFGRGTGFFARGGNVTPLLAPLSEPGSVMIFGA